MSSILDALKKLEKETISPPVSTLGTGQTRQSLKRFIRPRRRLWPWGGLGVVAFLLVAAVLYFASPGTDGPIRQVSRISPGVVKPKRPEAALPPVAKKPGPKAPPPALRAPAPKPAPPSLTHDNPRVVSPVVRSQEKKPSPPIAGSVSRERVAAAVPPPPEKPQPPKTEEEKPYSPPIRPLPSDSGLVLQALAWAPAPQQRFAVINDRILREGGTIEAMTVLRIEQTRIVLQKNGELWALRYKN